MNDNFTKLSHERTYAHIGCSSSVESDIKIYDITQHSILLFHV